MRTMLATLIGVLCSTALALGLGTAVDGPSADAVPSAHHVLADNQGPTVVTP
ncbi:hypothetical protein ACWGJB_46520 [Streptomyces sp. NPDC054813]